MFAEQMRGLRKRLLAAADQFRVDHGRKINPDGWPARLYLRAYADERESWLGVSWSAQVEIDKRAAERFPEVAAWVALEERRRKLYSEGGDWRQHSDAEREEFGRWRAAAEVVAKAVRDPWTKEQYAHWHAERSREIRERFEAGRQSLCPFFWSVVIAVVFYLCLIPAKRAIGRVLTAVGRGIAWVWKFVFGIYGRQVEWGLVAAQVFALFFVGTTYREKIGDGLVWMTMGTYHLGEATVDAGMETAQSLAEAPERIDRWNKQRKIDAEHDAENERWHAREASLEAERRRLEQEQQRVRELEEEADERRIEAQKIAWALAHPEDAAAKQALDAARVRANRVEIMFGVARAVVIALGGALALTLFVMGLLWLIDRGWHAITTAIAFVLALCFIGLERFAIGRGILVALDFLLRLPGIILRGIGAFLAGCLEGLALVFAFGLAVVRGACPMLIPVRKSGSAEPTV